jgi:hypothetical protein
VDADSLGQDGSTIPHAPAKPTFKLFVAKQDLEPGTVIDDPAKFFEPRNSPDAMEKAITADEINSIKGKTVRHSVFKDSVLTSKHFEGDEAPAVVIAPPVKKHILFIQNGGSAPLMHVFRDGVIEVGEPEHDKSKDKKPTGTSAGAAGDEKNG